MSTREQQREDELNMEIDENGFHRMGRTRWHAWTVASLAFSPLQQEVIYRSVGDLMQGSVADRSNVGHTHGQIMVNHRTEFLTGSDDTDIQACLQHFTLFFLENMYLVNVNRELSGIEHA